MKKRFGYQFWKDAGEMTSYAIVAISLLTTFTTKLAGVIGFSVILFYFIMMIIEEFRS